MSIDKATFENGEPTYYARREQLLAVVDAINQDVADDLAAGMSGYSGYSGKSGYSGYSGISGFSGYSGSGVSGYSGSGVSGYSGYSGISGYSGYSGISGYSGVDVWTRTGTVIAPTTTASSVQLTGGGLQVTGSVASSVGFVAAGGVAGLTRTGIQYTSGSTLMRMDFTGGLLTYQGTF